MLHRRECGDNALLLIAPERSHFSLKVQECMPGTNPPLVVWQDRRNGPTHDIYGARLNSSGTVIGSFPVSTQSGTQLSPALARGTANQLLIAYSGYTEYINNHPANTMRIWGKFHPFVGDEEGESNIAKQNKTRATIFRGPLQLPEGKKCRVFDITGRVVEPRKIQPGIYFIEVDGVVTRKVVKIR